MRKIVLLVLWSGWFLLVVGSGWAAPYGFDNDNQNWKTFEVSSIAVSNYEVEQILPDGASALWATETDGNGYVYLEADASKRPRPYSIGATDGLTVMGDLTGKTLMVDLKRLGDQFTTLAASGQETATVRWVISDTDRAEYGVGTWYVSKLTVSIPLNSVPGDWTSYSIKLDAANFFLWPHGVNAVNPGQEATFDEVLQTYKYVGLTLLSSAPDDAAFGGAWDGAPYASVWSYPDFGAYAPAPAGGSGGILGIDNFSVQDAIPTLDQWGMILLLLGLGLAAGWKLKNNKNLV